MIRDQHTIRRGLAIVALMTLTGGLRASDNDTQLWLKFYAEGKLGAGFSVKLEEEMRYQDNASELYDEETLLWVGYHVNDWLNVALAYRLVQERKNKPVVTPKTGTDGDVRYADVGDGDHYWQNEQRPTAEVTFKHKLAGWSLDDRVRFEWRMKDDGKDDYARFRNRIRAKSPWKFTDHKINPYLAWETFYEDKDGLSGSDKLNRHRLYAGLGAKLVGPVKGGLYYMMQNDRAGSGWDTLHVAGLELGASF